MVHERPVSMLLLLLLLLLLFVGCWPGGVGGHQLISNIFHSHAAYACCCAANNRSEPCHLVQVSFPFVG